jgi:hypothetical protein
MVWRWWWPSGAITLDVLASNDGGSDDRRGSGRGGIHFREERGGDRALRHTSVWVVAGGGLVLGGRRGREAGPVGWARPAWLTGFRLDE